MSHNIKPGKPRGSPEGLLASPEAKGSGSREPTRGSPKVGREAQKEEDDDISPKFPRSKGNPNDKTS